MKTAKIKLHDAVAYAASGEPEPQSGWFLKPSDVVSKDSLIIWATKAFPIVIMVSQSDFDDEIEVMYCER